MRQTTSSTTGKTKEIYFGGGCFWGTEKFFKAIPGVGEVVSGYAQGGVSEAPSYESVCTGQTGCTETVKVVYDPSVISLDALVLAFFHIIDPTVKNRQGADIGSQYQTGIYYTDEQDFAAIDKIMHIEDAIHGGIEVEAEKLTHFYPAEDYHQDYLAKNPGGYCHVPFSAFHTVDEIVHEANRLGLPADQAIIEAFAPEEYRVTQLAATEEPFTHKFAGSTERGLYVDITTGKPLFTSDDKYLSSCGWPAFTRTVEDNAAVEKVDDSHNRVRTEVRSSQGDAHLGHVFVGDAESPNGTRYCINGAALRFIPYDDLEEEGYGEYR